MPITDGWEATKLIREKERREAEEKVRFALCLIVRHPLVSCEFEFRQTHTPLLVCWFTLGAVRGRGGGRPRAHRGPYGR
jgi:hypothetical protein